MFLGSALTVIGGRNATGKSTILGILANSGEIKKKDGKTVYGTRFRAEFSEIFKGSQDYDQSQSDRLRIELINSDEQTVDYRSFRTSWQNNKGKSRFRLIPKKIDEFGTKTEAKMNYPVLYLGLSRLFPIGEADDSGIDVKVTKFESDEEKDWFIDNYCRILSINNSINNISSFSISENKKRGVGVTTDEYDYLTNSSGQDNLGQVLLALLSFKRLKTEREQWNGGLFLIDEIDSTLHPAAQKKLIDLLLKEAKEINVQVVVTSHSSDLLKYIAKKTEHNSKPYNVIELYYLTNANRRLEIKRNPSSEFIDHDLNITSQVQDKAKIRVYTEDAEGRWLAQSILCDYLPSINLLDVTIGCDALVSLYKSDLSYFGNSLIIFDGDVTEQHLSPIKSYIKRFKNVLTLPGGNSPEKVLYEYIMSLQPEHDYWKVSDEIGFTWDYFNENGPASYGRGTEREQYKDWFRDHKDAFDSTNLIGFWIEDNKTLIDDFIDSFIQSYNAIAKRIGKSEISIPDDL